MRAVAIRVPRWREPPRQAPARAVGRVGGRRGAPARLGRSLRGGDDRLGHPVDRVVAQAGRAEQLLGAFLRTADDHAGLRARPLERLLDLGADRVRELGRLMARLLEQPRRRASASATSCDASCWASCSVWRDSLLAAFIISARWRSLSWR